MVGKTLDRYQVESDTLIFRQLHESLAYLRKPDGVFLRRVDPMGEFLTNLIKALCLGLAASHAINEGIVQDGQKPCLHVATIAETATPLIGAQKRVLYEILGCCVVPGEGPRVTPERTQLTDDVEEVLPAVHEEYTEPMIILFPGLSIFSAF